LRKKPSRSKPIGYWRGSTIRSERGDSGDDRSQAGSADRERWH
jgi:hypothetical protein